jgi:hypothetical protein
MQPIELSDSSEEAFFYYSCSICSADLDNNDTGFTFTTVIINEQQVTALMNTGTPSNFIHLLLVKDLHLSVTNQKFIAANRKKFSVSGKIKLKFNLPNITCLKMCTQTFYVSDKIPYKVIFGHNTIRQQGLILHEAENHII